MGPPAGPKQPAIGPRTSPSEMNETSATASADGLGQAVGAERPGVGPLHRHDPWIAAQRRRPAGRGRRRPHRPASRRAGATRRVKPPVEAPTSRQTRPRRIDRERSERRGELVAAARHVRLGRLDGERDGRVHQVAGLPVAPGRVTLADPDLAAEDERLGTGPRLGQAPVDEQLIESSASRAAGLDRLGAHRPIVAQPAHRRHLLPPPGAAAHAVTRPPVRPRGRSAGPDRRWQPASARGCRASRGSGPRCPARRVGSAGADRPPSRGRRSGRPGSRWILSATSR